VAVVSEQWRAKPFSKGHFPFFIFHSRIQFRSATEGQNRHRGGKGSQQATAVRNPQITVPGALATALSKRRLSKASPTNHAYTKRVVGLNLERLDLGSAVANAPGTVIEPSCC
jgi:hypothetical protein